MSQLESLERDLLANLKRLKKLKVDKAEDLKMIDLLPKPELVEVRAATTAPATDPANMGFPKIPLSQTIRVAPPGKEQYPVGMPNDFGDPDDGPIMPSPQSLSMTDRFINIYKNPQSYRLTPARKCAWEGPPSNVDASDPRVQDIVNRCRSYYSESEAVWQSQGRPFPNIAEALKERMDSPEMEIEQEGVPQGPPPLPGTGPKKHTPPGMQRFKPRNVRSQSLRGDG
jgi:hypothetical protein